MMKKLKSYARIITLAICGVLTTQTVYATQIIDADMCSFVMENIQQQAPPQESESALISTYRSLDELFKSNKITDYATVVDDQKASAILGDNEASVNILNDRLSSFFIQNQTAIYPDRKKKYDFIVLGTSGINVFVERLALLAEMSNKEILDVGRIVMLTGSHAHRDDLKDVDYLLNMVTLFTDRFDLANFDAAGLQVYLAEKVKEKWTHQTGVEVAWKLLESCPTMKSLHQKFEFFTIPSSPKARTEELLGAFIEQELNSTPQDYSIAFLCNAQGAPKTKQLVTNVFGEAKADFLICGPLKDEAEAQLHKDTPPQRAMTRLFHFYRLLEAQLGQDIKTSH